MVTASKMLPNIEADNVNLTIHASICFVDM